MTETVKLSDFVKEHDITMIYRQSDRNPHMEDSDSMDNYRVTLRCESRRMSLYFSKGIGHNGKPPEIEEVLDCLAGDSAGIENASSFEDFCDELGYEEDSRKAEKIYKATLSQAVRLRNLLGNELYETLLWNIERC